MKKKLVIVWLCLGIVAGILAGCGSNTNRKAEDAADTGSAKGEAVMNTVRVTPTEDMEELEEGLSMIRYEGNYGFDEFLDRGGAVTDGEVAAFLMESLSEGGLSLIFGGNPFGCSTLSVAGGDGSYLFGRNFDWNTCEGLIVSARPETGYSSVSTVNLDFITSGGVDISRLPDNVQAIMAMYAPLDGMNEQGFAVSVNMIQDSDSIEQNTDKPDITTTTAVRLLLDRAATVSEAVELLSQYDMHASMGMMVHFALADAQGNSAVVEYIDHEMSVVETSVVTNFYLTEGRKYGIGTGQSHERYEILTDTLKEKQTMTEQEVRDALDSVSKDNFNEYESTEWSIVMNQEARELTYFHRENYGKGYTLSIE